MYQYLLRYPGREQYDTSSRRMGVSRTGPVVCFNRSAEGPKVGSIGSYLGYRAQGLRP